MWRTKRNSDWTYDKRDNHNRSSNSGSDADTIGKSSSCNRLEKNGNRDNVQFSSAQSSRSKTSKIENKVSNWCCAGCCGTRDNKESNKRHSVSTGLSSSPDKETRQYSPQYEEMQQVETNVKCKDSSYEHVKPVQSRSQKESPSVVEETPVVYHGYSQHTDNEVVEEELKVPTVHAQLEQEFKAQKQIEDERRNELQRQQKEEDEKEKELQRWKDEEEDREKDFKRQQKEEEERHKQLQRQQIEEDDREKELKRRQNEEEEREKELYQQIEEVERENELQRQHKDKEEWEKELHQLKEQEEREKELQRQKNDEEEREKEIQRQQKEQEERETDIKRQQLEEEEREKELRHQQKEDEERERERQRQLKLTGERENEQRAQKQKLKLEEHERSKEQQRIQQQGFVQQLAQQQAEQRQSADEQLEGMESPERQEFYNKPASQVPYVSTRNDYFRKNQANNPESHPPSYTHHTFEHQKIKPKEQKQIKLINSNDRYSTDITRDNIGRKRTNNPKIYRPDILPNKSTHTPEEDGTVDHGEKEHIADKRKRQRRLNLINSNDRYVKGAADDIIGKRGLTNPMMYRPYTIEKPVFNDIP